LEGDLVAEALDFADQAAAVALGVLGVAAVEELFAELVVRNALVEDVVGGGKDLVAVATIALACPRRLSAH
jgi:hypothetical protein